MGGSAVKAVVLFFALIAVPLFSQDARVPIAKTVTLAVETDGTPPLQYQWHRDGQPLAGENRPQLVLANFGPEHGGLYHCRVSNEAGSVDSNKVQLTPVKQPSKSTITVNIAVGGVNP